MMAEDRIPRKELCGSEKAGGTGKRRLRIGNVELDNNLILAPMAGVTDLPFRILCKEQGCGLLCTEMVSAKAILYKTAIRGNF